MVLEEGKIYSNEDMAKWFQITLGSFKNAKRKKLEYLKFFAEFEEIKGKIHIKKVYQAQYLNPRDKEQNDKLYQEAIVRVIEKQPLQLFITCAGRVAQLKDEQLERLQHKFTTCYQYVKRNLKIVADGSEREWCQRFYNSEVDFIPLSDEQLVFWKTIIDKQLGTEQSEILAKIKSQQDQGELTDQEAERYILNTVSYQWAQAKEEFFKKYKFEPISVPRWQLNAIILKALGEEI